MELEAVLTFLYERIKKHRIEGKHENALEAFNLIHSLTSEINSIVTADIRRLLYRIYEEFTIFSYYVGLKAEGLLLADKLLFNSEAHLHINCNLIANNQRYYMDKLNYLERKQIKIKCEEHYIEMNPSIIKYKDGYIVNCRTVNFGVRPGGHYYAKTSDGIINTINYLLIMNDKFEVLNQIKLIDLSIYQEYDHRPVKGLEDVILFQYKNELWLTCTTLDTMPNGIPQISLCYVGDIDFIYELRDIDSININVKRPLSLLDSNRAEKNWLPFVYQDQIHFIYGYPIIRYINDEKIKEEIGYLDTELKINHDNKLSFKRFRGSGGPVKFVYNEISGYLTVVHEVSWCQDSSRIYTHRFVFFDENFEIKYLSLPWIFEQHGLEFCRSMAYADNQTLIITCGLKDNEAWLYFVDTATIKLYPIDYLILS